MNGKKKSNMWLVICLLMLALAVAGPAAGRTITVDDNEPADFKSIQAAINAAVSGVDEIEVAPGTYNEYISFIGKAVRLYSSDGPQATTINGSGYYHVVVFASGEVRNTVLEGFTITGGIANGVADIDKAGGGILCVSSSPTIVNCIVTGNVAVLGGGIYGIFSNLAIIGCKIHYNVATLNGGGLYFSWFYPVVINCEIRNNMAINGGGMVSDYSQPTITNSTFSANTATVGFSGALASLADGIGNTPYITNCIFWGDSPAEIAYAEFPPFVFYCDVQGFVWPLEGNISADPLFANAAGGNLQLSPGSPCINAGYNAADTDIFTADVQPLPEDDLNGSPRIYPSVVDMGAYEHRDSDGDGITDGFDTPSVHNLTQGTDHFTLQAAINEASGGDEISADQGRYNESVDLKGKAVILRSNDPNDPNVVAATIIDATGLGTFTVVCASGEGLDTVLSGFTITGGSAAVGGGMLNYSSSPTVTHCVFTGNTATNGGGMGNMSCSPKVIDCNFNSNNASKSGGGMMNITSSPTVTNCVFTNNKTNYSGDIWYLGGAGMCNSNSSSPVVTKCSFIENNTNKAGGGINNQGGSNPTVTDCNFIGNTAIKDGGGIYSYESEPNVFNCTFIGNIAGKDFVGGGDGGGLMNDRSKSTVIDCIFRGNTANWGGGLGNYVSSPTVTDCNFSYNTANVDGGGLFNDNSSHPRVFDCMFNTNTAVGYGGGMHNWKGSTPWVNRCSFINNSSNDGGGGMCNHNSSPTVSHCRFSDNRCTLDGGGMWNYANGPTVVNCVFNNNSATWYGGGVSDDGSNSTYTNCTFSGNTASGAGGAISKDETSGTTLTNCILWGDSSPNGSEIFGVALVTYSDVQGISGGTGNINADPCFADALGGNLRLLPGSPCTDAGDNDAVPAGITTDLNGWMRFIDNLCTDDTGNPGTVGPPVVDMGAYEFLPADIHSNGSVDLADFSSFASYWQDTGCGRCGGSDLTCDADVDLDDLQEFVAHWLAGLK